MKPDNTILLRLVRASAQGIADECTAILGSAPPADREPLASTAVAVADGVPPPAVAEPATPPPAKRGRKPAAPAPVAEPAVVNEPPAPTNVTTEPAPQPAAAPPVDLGKSSVTETELASAAGEVKADPAKLARYIEWRNQSTFNTADGGVMSGEGKSLAQIPNVGDNWDRVLEAMRRASV